MSQKSYVKEHVCLEDYFVVGLPQFDDMAVTFKVQCRVCNRIFWARYDWVEFIFDPDLIGLPLER